MFILESGSTSASQLDNTLRPSPLVSILLLEILQIVAAQLASIDLRSLIPLSLVSKNFQAIAERELYRCISISCYHIAFVKHRRGGQFGTVESLCNALLSSTRDGSRRLGYIKVLRLRNIRCV